MVGQLSKSKKSSNKKLAIIFIGLIIIGIAYEQLKKKENLDDKKENLDEKKENNSSLNTAYNVVKSKIQEFKIPGLNL